MRPVNHCTTRIARRLAARRRSPLLIAACLLLTSTAGAVRAEITLEEAVDLVRDAPGTDHSLRDFWSVVLPDRYGVAYEDPLALRVFDEGEIPVSACVSASSADIPPAFYCPIDSTMAVSTEFLAGMAVEHGYIAPLVVVAHEWGHHIQYLLGTSDDIDKRNELQADCFAGLYLRHLVDANIIAASDIAGSIGLVFDAGDDPALPRAWYDPDVHGWSNQRRQALGTAYVTGDERYCTAYSQWAESPAVPLGETTILPGPGVTSRRAPNDDSVLFSLPGGDVVVALVEADSEATAADELRRELAWRFPEGLELAGIDGGWLSAHGWATGDGAATTFAVRDAGGVQTAVGRALIQRPTGGLSQLFVSYADLVAGDSLTGAGDALMALLWGYCDRRASVPANCPPGGSPRVDIGLATPPPYAEPTFVPTATYGPSSPGSDRRDPLQPRSMYAYLRRLVPPTMRDTCRRWWRSNDPDAFDRGVVAAIDCDPMSEGVVELAFYGFNDSDALETHFMVGMAEKTTVPRSEDACLDGGRGWQRWAGGWIACWVTESRSPHAVNIRWTDESRLVYGILEGPPESQSDLLYWWGTHYGE